MSRQALLCVAIALGSSLSLIAQRTNDFGLWGTVSYGQKINKELDFSIDQEFRLEENASQLGRAFTNLGMDYEVLDWLYFGANYRFILDRRGDGSYGMRHRLMADLAAQQKLRRFTFSYRARLQWEVRGTNYEQEYGFSPAWDLRNTFKVEYRINRQAELYASMDIRFLLRDANVPYHQGFDRDRARMGIDFKLAENRKLDIFLLSSRDWNVNEPKQLFVIGAEFAFGSNRMMMGS